MTKTAVAVETFFRRAAVRKRLLNSPLKVLENND